VLIHTELVAFVERNNETSMKLMTGSFLSAIFGFACLIVLALLGMQYDSWTLQICVAAVAVVASSIAVGIGFPTALPWLYPISFSLPMILIGIQAALSKSPPTILELGCVTLVVGCAAVYISKVHFFNGK